MMRHATIITSVFLLVGAGAAWSSAAPQNAPTSEPPKANSKEATPAAQNTPPEAQDGSEREDESQRRPRVKPRLGDRLTLDDGVDAAMAGPIPGGRPDLRRGLDRGFGRGDRDFTPEQVERVMQVVRDLDPDRAVRLEELRTSEPERFTMGLARAGRHLLGLSLLKDRDPDLYELKIAELRLSQQINRIAQEILAARETCSEGELERLESMLRERLRELSQLNFRVRGREIIMLEEHLKSTREKLVDDITHSEERIEQRMAELLHKSDDGDDAGAESFAVEAAVP